MSKNKEISSKNKQNSSELSKQEDSIKIQHFGIAENGSL